jgi:ribonuclease HI
VLTIPKTTPSHPKEIDVFIDGASRGNPGPAGIGIIIKDKSGRVLKEYKEYLGSNYTNNQAEYLALVKALELASKVVKGIIYIFSDSELLVRQMNGVYRVRKHHLQELYRKVRVLEEYFQRVDYTHIRRERNKDADGLANQAIDEAL